MDTLAERDVFRAERAERAAVAAGLFARAMAADASADEMRAWSAADSAARAHSWEGRDVMAAGYRVGSEDMVDGHDATCTEVFVTMEAAGWKYSWPRGAAEATWSRGGVTVSAWWARDVVPWGDHWQVWGVDNVQRPTDEYGQWYVD